MRSLKDYLKLKLKKYRQEWGLCIIEGKRLCEEALTSDWTIEAAFISENFANDAYYRTIKKLFSERKITPSILGLSDFKNLADTETPQGILLVMKIPQQAGIPEKIIANADWLLLLESVRDPGNLGTIIRTADWFGVPLILSSSDSVDFYNSKVIRGSMGSIFRVPCVEIQDMKSLLSFLKKRNFTIIGTSPEARLGLDDFTGQPPFAIVLGSEAAGLSDGLSRQINSIIRINRRGDAESLNVAVAAGIILHHFSNLMVKS